MADIIIPDDCGLVTSTWTMSGKSNPMTSTLGVRDISSGDPEAILEEVYNGWTQSGGFCSATQMGTSFRFEGVSMIWNAGSGVFEGYAYGDPVQGTATNANPMIVGNTLLLQKRTARIGRHFRGRMYLPIMGLNEAGVDAMGNIDSSSLTILRAAMAITTDFWDASTTWQSVLLHASMDVTPGYTPITSWNLQGKVATQRRRLRS